MEQALEKPPIILQTMWRSCGTYVWSKFREKPNFCTFVEPLHEKLLHATSASFQAERDDGVEQRLRHPPIDRHYFAEYPFLESGGVPLFRKRFSFENYFMPAEQRDPELQAYLCSLFAHSGKQGRQPLLKFCRGGLRTAWLARRFSPVMIYVVRDPDAMFRSYWSFGGAQSYFLFALAMIVSKNRDCELFTEAAELLRIPAVVKPSVTEEMAQIYGATRSFTPQIWRDLFLLFWALHMCHNRAWSQAVLDMDLLATDKVYRKRMERRLAHLANTRLTFTGVQQPRTPEAPGVVLSTSGIALAHNAIQKLRESCTRKTVGPLSTGSMQVLDALL